MSLDWRKKRIEVVDAVYEYCGDCISCKKNLYVCVSHPIRADDALEGRVATFYADGAKRCKECADDRL